MIASFQIINNERVEQTGHVRWNALICRLCAERGTAMQEMLLSIFTKKVHDSILTLFFAVTLSSDPYNLFDL